MLYLIPVNISDAPLEQVLPPYNREVCLRLRRFIVENTRTARRFLRRLSREMPIDECTFSELNAHTTRQELEEMLAPMLRGEDVGVMSEAGCPCVADPGSIVVEAAQRHGIKVVPLVGPSSILMSLMASGFNGQGFAFHGYLPIEKSDRIRRIKDLEQDSRRHDTTHIFIETPYRNQGMLDTLTETLQPGTPLCVALAITDPENESVRTMPAKQWRGVQLPKKLPAIFLIFHS